MKKLILPLLLLVMTTLFNACNKEAASEFANLCPADTFDALPLNEVQVIGTHNSYRLKTYEPLFNFLSLVSGLIDLEDIKEWDFTHDPMATQMEDYQVRSLEIDIYNDPTGGRFYRRMGNALVGQPVASGIPALQEPGMKVLHVPDVDYMTHHITFKNALQDLLSWSEGHAGHLPVYVLIEFKDEAIPLPGYANSLPFDAEAKTAFATEIREVMPMEKLITPEDVRTGHADLESAIDARGWPSISEARGKILFIGLQSEEVDGLVFGSNSTNSVNGDYMFKIMNSPDQYAQQIATALANGCMVRTRADSGTYEARNGQTARRERAIASGAQIISTDYYRPDPRHETSPRDWSNYAVQWPAGTSARTLSGCYSYD